MEYVTAVISDLAGGLDGVRQILQIGCMLISKTDCIYSRCMGAVALSALAFYSTSTRRTQDSRRLADFSASLSIKELLTLAIA
jgi:hypothetical protein